MHFWLEKLDLFIITIIITVYNYNTSGSFDIFKNLGNEPNKDFLLYSKKKNNSNISNVENKWTS